MSSKGGRKKLTIFLASSTEAVPAMRKVVDWIKASGRGHIARPWTDSDIFVPGNSVWADLHRIAGEVDAAIAIFASDDAVKFRSKNVAQARDNAMVEYGLFAGKLGPGRTAFCAERGVKIPSDVRGIGYLELAPKGASPAEARAKNRLAAKKVDLWLQHVERLAPATTTPLSKKEKERRIRTAEDVLIEAIYGAPPGRAPVDTINSFAGDLLVRDTVSGVLPQRVSSSVDLRIERNGDGVCSMREKVKFRGREVSLTPFTMAGDAAVPDVQDLQVSIRSLTPGFTARSMIAVSSPNKHVALLGFRPSIPEGTEIQYQVAWRWPGMWERLIKGEADYWKQEIEAAESPSVRFRVLVHKRLGKVDFDSRGEGKIVQRTGPSANDGYWSYSMSLRDLSPKSTIHLYLLPR